MGEWLLAAPIVLEGAPAGALVTAGASAGVGAGISGISFIAPAAGAAAAGSALSLSNVLSGVGAASALAGGAQGAAGADFEAAQFREEQENARVAAAQEEVQRRRQLARTLSSINAIRAGRGLDVFGTGTGRAQREDVIKESEEDIATSRLNAMNRSRRFGLSAEQSELKGRGELLGGVGTAAAILGKSFSRT